MSKRLLLVLVAVAFVSVALIAAPAAAQDADTTTTTLVEVPAQDIVPEPGTGEEPEDPGDRGGTLQVAVLVLLVVAIGGVIALVVRQSQQARAAR